MKPLETPEEMTKERYAAAWGDDYRLEDIRETYAAGVREDRRLIAEALEEKARYYERNPSVRDILRECAREILGAS